MRLPALGFSFLATILAGAALGDDPKPGDILARRGDEMVACGQLVHTTTPIITWMDPGGYDAYRTERRFAPLDVASFEKSKGETLKTPNRFGLRRVKLAPERLEQVRGGGWDLPLLQETVDQFVIHFDACGTSRKCFEVLQDERGLSVHFMLDLDGTIYQTLDLKEGAFHATMANGRSIGIEIANIGTFPPDAKKSPRVARWYGRDADGKTRITPPDQTLLPARPAGSPPLRPDRDDPVVGTVQGQDLTMYDLTPQQYESLIKLTAALCRTFPKIRCDYPRDAQGHLAPAKLGDDVYHGYQGILGHYHVQANKVDPGPAFQWDRLIDGTRTLLAK